MSEEDKVALFRKIIEKYKEELAEAMVREYMFQLEVLKPVHLGKQQAEENVGIYQKRIRYIKENIRSVQLYAEEHDLKL